MEKSANKRWKESGTTLSFKEWIERDNLKKDSFINFDSGLPDPSPISDTAKNILEEQKKSIEQTIGLKNPDSIDNTTIFGLDKKVLMFSGLVISASLVYFFYGRIKKNK